MHHKPAELEVENEILRRLTSLTNQVKLDRVDDNLLTEFEYRQLTKKALSVQKLVRKYTLLALIELNYSRNVVEAEKLYNIAIKHDCSDIPSWTTFVAFLAARGFGSKAIEYAAKSIDYVASPETLHNALLHAIYALDLDVIETCVSICSEMKYIGQPCQPDCWDEAVDLLGEIKQFMQNENYEHKLVTQILGAVQDAIGANGYVVKGNAGQATPKNGEWIVSYTVAETDMDKIGELNMVVADLFATNDWLDSKVVVYVMPHGV